MPSQGVIGQDCQLMALARPPHPPCDALLLYGMSKYATGVA
jgi:hypothetical protein